MKHFNGHKETVVCLDLHKNKFVSGSKDCTAKSEQVKSTSQRVLICYRKINRICIAPLKTNVILFQQKLPWTGTHFFICHKWSLSIQILYEMVY